MMEILKNQFFAYSFLILLGLVVGYGIHRSFFYFVKRKSKLINQIYIKNLARTMGYIVPLLFAAISVKYSHLYPWEIPLKSSPDKIIDIILVIAGSIVLSEVFIFLFDKRSQSKSNSSTSLIHIIIRVAVYTFSAIIISNILEYDIKAILTALGVGGLAVALALQDTLGNLFAGMHIIAAKQLKPGDYIKLDTGEEGYVLDINWRNTEIKTLLENVVVVPNSKISSANITNYFTFQKNLYFHVEVGVHYDSDLQKVENVTLDVAKEVLDEFDTIPKNFEPKVRFYEFADSSINFKVWLASDVYENHYIIKHEFIKRLQKRFAKEGIVIPFPIRTLYLQKDEGLKL